MNFQQYLNSQRDICMEFLSDPRMIRIFRRFWEAGRTQQQSYLIGEMRENAVHWYGKNPHAFQVGTKFFALPPAQTPHDPSVAEKAVYWFACLQRIAALLEIPDDQPVTSVAEVLEGVLKELKAEKIEDLRERVKKLEAEIKYRDHMAKVKF